MEGQIDEQQRLDRSELVMAEQMNIMDQENRKKIASGQKTSGVKKKRETTIE